MPRELDFVGVRFDNRMLSMSHTQFHFVDIAMGWALKLSFSFFFSLAFLLLFANDDLKKQLSFQEGILVSESQNASS